MKLIGLIALAALTATSAPVMAQTVRHTEVTRTTTVERHTGPGMHRPKRKVCSVKWYHHKKVRRCWWR